MVAAIALWVFWTYGRDLPDYQQMANYEPPVVTRIHAGDGALLAEYANEKRLFVPVRAMPPMLVKAFVSAEDKGFYQHFGVDLRALARAAVTNLLNYGTGRRPIGASTITQQVTKNFLLTNELSIERKIKEGKSVGIEKLNMFVRSRSLWEAKGPKYFDMSKYFVIDTDSLEIIKEVK